jgi:hypothetical protein
MGKLKEGWRFVYDADYDSWEAITDEAFSTKEDAIEYIGHLEQTKQIVRDIERRTHETLPLKIQRLKDAIFVKGLTNDENQKKQVIELEGMIKALEWEQEELHSIFQRTEYTPYKIINQVKSKQK